MFKSDTEGQDRIEKFQYRPGRQVEVKSHPGEVDTIVSYDPMMVPPITLEKDPQPRYPEELRFVTKKGDRIHWLRAFYSQQVG